MTSLQKRPLFTSTPAPYTGPASYDSVMADMTGVGEGVWINAGFAKAGSVEIAGTFSALSVQLLGSNSSQEPANLYTVTVGGTVTSTDVLTLTFANPNIVNGTEAVAYTAQGGDTTTTIAAALAAAINADTILNGLGITATSAVAVVTVTYPNGVQPGQEGGSPTEPATQNVTVITGSLSGGATETLTVANASVGVNIGTPLTDLGITPFSILPPPRWIKAVVGTFTGTRVLANLHMVA